MSWVARKTRGRYFKVCIYSYTQLFAIWTNCRQSCASTSSASCLLILFSLLFLCFAFFLFFFVFRFLLVRPSAAQQLSRYLQVGSQPGGQRKKEKGKESAAKSNQMVKAIEPNWAQCKEYNLQYLHSLLLVLSSFKRNWEKKRHLSSANGDWQFDEKLCKGQYVDRCSLEPCCQINIIPTFLSP